MDGSDKKDAMGDSRGSHETVLGQAGILLSSITKERHHSKDALHERCLICCHALSTGMAHFAVKCNKTNYALRTSHVCVNMVLHTYETLTIYARP
jgi:hypothetical protein